MEKARRSSLRNPNVHDLQKMLNNQNKHLNFDLDTIKENEEEVSEFVLLISEKRRKGKKIRRNEKTIIEKRISNS